jgi:hypothetical protein
LSDFSYVVEIKPPPPPPAPVAAPEPVADVPAAPPVAQPFVPTAQPTSPGAAEAAPVVGDPAVQLAVPTVDEHTWPCPSCGTSVPMSLDFCNSCGAGFLASVSDGASVRVPLVGDVSKITSGQRLALAAGVALSLMLVILLLATIGGKFL